MIRRGPVGVGSRTTEVGYSFHHVMSLVHAAHPQGWLLQVLTLTAWLRQPQLVTPLLCEVTQVPVPWEEAALFSSWCFAVGA